MMVIVSEVIMSEKYSEFCSFPSFLSKRKIDVEICLGSDELHAIMCLILGCPIISGPDFPVKEYFGEAFQMTFLF